MGQSKKNMERWDIMDKCHETAKIRHSASATISKPRVFGPSRCGNGR